ncbi:TatD family hydrolase [Thermophagus xiamenensis]|uniref:TatD DNase family protein n=1 Tax=Thermophagus xiamenensis TaxID=385682 RepID=A0A1I1Y451_9BACT|nr:TatD family hydrolase [Thermophagus xiamenensis]SFE12600.1 TatD DNase family protein [Thermophagus xiamenensis]
MIDSHSHIFLPEFDQDRDEVVLRAKEAGVTKILMPNIDEQTISSILNTEATYPGYCLAMMGLHPTSVKENFLEQLGIIEQWLEKKDFVAIGEIGIDLYWDKSREKEQRQVFRTQLQWARETEKPVVIHVREAFDAVFEEMEKVYDHRLKGVFHSFSGDESQAARALEYENFMLGINGIVTFKNSGLGNVVQKLGPDRLIIETDAPYLTPVPFRGKRNQPAFLTYTLKKLAEIFALTTEELDRITTRNTAQLFGLQL